jgi:hypothetical protein
VTVSLLAVYVLEHGDEGTRCDVVLLRAGVVTDSLLFFICVNF